MSNNVGQLLQQSGILPTNVVAELQRWNPLDAETSAEDSAPVDPQQVPLLLEQLLQSSDQVAIKETDLEVRQQYLRTERPCTLCITSSAGQTARAQCTYGRTALGDVLLPWMGSLNVVDALQDCVVDLEDEDTRLELSNPRELFFGAHKMFTVWNAK